MNRWFGLVEKSMITSELEMDRKDGCFYEKRKLQSELELNIEK